LGLIILILKIATFTINFLAGENNGAQNRTQ